MKTWIQNVRLVDAEQDRLGDVLMVDGRLHSIGTVAIEDAFDATIIDATGYILMPGFVDLHAHFRDPGYCHKENLESGIRAAASGGYTTVNCMANTNPICDSKEVYTDIMTRGNVSGELHLFQVMSVTKGLLGKEIVDMDALPEGCRILSDDGRDWMSAHTMYQACVQAKQADVCLMVHAEEPEISPYDYRTAEDLITLRDTYLAKRTGAHVHFSHVSTVDALEAIRAAKRTGAQVTCEVTPHHIALADVNYRVNPPIRTKVDVLAMIAGLVDGTVDAIATDHAPHTSADKEAGAPGMVGLETAFAICYTHLVEAGHMSLSDLSRVMSAGGAKVLGLSDRGYLREGMLADLVLVDTQEVTIDPETFASKGRNTPFAGQKLKGRIIMTFCQGRRTK